MLSSPRACLATWWNNPRPHLASDRAQPGDSGSSALRANLGEGGERGYVRVDAQAGRHAELGDRVMTEATL
jgi:hypothetical protein